jgi:excisionase family DNA binding protein
MTLDAHEIKKGPRFSKTPLLDRIAVTVREAAILIGTSDKQIRKALYARELPAAKLGNAYAIGVDDLRKWFDGKKKDAVMA